MRDILTISVPAERVKLIKAIVKKRKFKSISEYINFSIDQEQKMISEDQVLRYAKRTQKSYKAGKTYQGLYALHQAKHEAK